MAEDWKDPYAKTETQDTGWQDPYAEKAPSTVLGEIPKGLAAGVQQVRGFGYGMGALAGEVTGIQPVKDWAKEGLADVKEKTPKAAVPSYKDVESVSDAAKYLAYGVSSNIPNIALSVAGGGLGMMAGRKLAAGAVEKVVEGAAKTALVKGAERGALIGAGLSSIAMETGSIAADQLEETGKVHPLRALAGAVPAGLLDVVPEWYLAKRLGIFGGATGFAGKGLKDRAVQGAKEFGKTAMMEAPTEAMQSVLERASVPGKSLTNREAWDEYIDSFILGGVTGGVFGGVGGMMKKADTPAQQALSKDPIANDIETTLASDELKDMAEAIKVPVMDFTGMGAVEGAGRGPEAMGGYGMVPAEPAPIVPERPVAPAAPVAPVEAPPVVPEAAKTPYFNPAGYASEGEALVSIKAKKLKLGDYEITPREGRYFVEPKVVSQNPEIVQPAPAGEAETIKKDTPEFYKAEAERAGVKFNGIQQGVPGKVADFPFFTDPQTGTTFTTEPGETVEDALARKRKQFADYEAGQGAKKEEIPVAPVAVEPEIKVADTTVPETPVKTSNVDSKLTEIRDYKGGDFSPTKTRLYQELGIESVEGIRLADAEATGRLLEMVRDGKATGAEWEKHVDRLVAENRVSGISDEVKQEARKRLDRLDEITADETTRKEQGIVVPPKIDLYDFAEGLVNKGIDRQSSYGQYVILMDLKPQLSAKDWYKIYDSAKGTAKTRPAKSVPPESTTVPIKDTAKITEGQYGNKGAYVTEVIGGRKKGVIDAKTGGTKEHVDALIDKGIDEITVRPGANTEQIKARLTELGWKQTDIDKAIWQKSPSPVKVETPVSTKPQSSEDAQKDIDDYEDELASKYGMDAVLNAPISDPTFYEKMDVPIPETKISPAELEKLRNLYNARDKIDTGDLTTWRNTVIKNSGLDAGEASKALENAYLPAPDSTIGVYHTSDKLRKWNVEITANLRSFYNSFSKGTYAEFRWGGTADNPTLEGSVYDEDLRSATWDKEALAKTEKLYNAISETQSAPPINLQGIFRKEARTSPISRKQIETGKESIETEGKGTAAVREKIKKMKENKPKPEQEGLKFSTKGVTINETGWTDAPMEDESVAVLRREMSSELGREVADGSVTQMVFVPKPATAKAERDTGRNIRIRDRQGAELRNNVSERGAEYSRQIQKIARVFGKDVIWIRMSDPVLSRINGMESDKIPGKIFINIEATDPHLSVLGHELTHKIKSESTELYEELKNYLQPLMNDVEGYADLRRKSEEGLTKKTETDFYEEIIADFAGEQFANPEFWDDMAKSKPTLFEKVAQIARDIITKTIKALGINTNVISQAFFKDIVRARKALVDAMSKYAEQKGKATPEGELRLSVPIPEAIKTQMGSQSASWNSPEPSRMSDFIYTFVDKFKDLRDVVKAIKKLSGKLKDEINPDIKQRLYTSIVAEKSAEFLDKEFGPIKQLMVQSKVNLDDFQDYLWNRTAEETNIHIASINPDLPDKGSGITTAAARKYLASLDPAKKRTYERLAKLTDKILAENRKLIVDYQLESQESVDKWAAAYPHYAPLFREDIDAMLGTGEGFSVTGPTSRKRKGSERKVIDILAHIAEQREHIIARGEKNILSTALYNLAKAYPNSEFWSIAKPRVIKDAVNVNTGEPVPDLSYRNKNNVVMSRQLDPKTGRIIERGVEFNTNNKVAERMSMAFKNLD
ncbi:MAG: hypothetical protein WC294_00005, partial [Methanoregula sp.]